MLLLAPALIATPALADPPPGRGGGQGGGGGQGQGRGGGQGQGQGNRGNQGGGSPPGQAARFRGDDPAIIRNWQAANPGWSPRPLPPGQMRQLARGRPLPPGIARQAVPPGLLAQLPAYPGYSYTMIGTSIVLLGSGGAVVDILAGLF